MLILQQLIPLKLICLPYSHLLLEGVEITLEPIDLHRTFCSTFSQLAIDLGFLRQLGLEELDLGIHMIHLSIGDLLSGLANFDLVDGLLDGKEI